MDPDFVPIQFGHDLVQVGRYIEVNEPPDAQGFRKVLTPVFGQLLMETTNAQHDMAPDEHIPHFWPGNLITKQISVPTWAPVFRIQWRDLLFDVHELNPGDLQRLKTTFVRRIEAAREIHKGSVAKWIEELPPQRHPGDGIPELSLEIAGDVCAVLEAGVFLTMSAVALREVVARQKTYDVFLSYSSTDRSKVVQLTKKLKNRGLSVWLDLFELRPGVPTQDDLEDIIMKCKSAAICFGTSGIGPWQEAEAQALLKRFIDEKKTGKRFPVIPVLLPDAASPAPNLPVILQGFTWVDLRRGFTKAELDRLQYGITGIKPDMP